MENEKGAAVVPPGSIKANGRYMDHSSTVANHCAGPDFSSVFYYGNINKTEDNMTKLMLCTPNWKKYKPIPYPHFLF
jgi:hypothetical protein